MYLDEGSEAPADETTGTPGDTADATTTEEATDAELDAFLSGVDEEGNPQPEHDATQDGSTPAPKDGETKEKAEEEPDEKTAKGGEESARVATLEKKLEEALQRIDAKETFIQRQASEIGGLRKAKDQLLTERENLAAGLQDRHLENPAQAVQDQLRINKIDEQVEQIDTAVDLESHSQATQQTFNSYFKPGDVTVEDMAQSLLRDGIPQQQVAQFMQAPYEAFSGAALVQLGFRARAETTLMKVVDAAKKIKTERDEALAQLKKRRSPTEIMQGIERAARQTPDLTASNGKGAVSKNGTASFEAIHNMSDKQIEEFLNSNE